MYPYKEEWLAKLFRGEQTLLQIVTLVAMIVLLISIVRWYRPSLMTLIRTLLFWAFALMTVLSMVFIR